MAELIERIKWPLRMIVRVLWLSTETHTDIPIFTFGL